MSEQSFKRRGFLMGLGGATLTAGCMGRSQAPSEPRNRAAEIDARVSETLNYLFTTYPGTVELDNKSVGKLVMPLVTKGGIGFGGAYGRGALLVGNAPVGYYSQTQASFGLQFGAQQYATVLFFMTQAALAEFRNSEGWALGADGDFVLLNQGENITADTNTTLAPVIAVAFGQAGLHAGATIKGAKYSRIIP